MKFSYLYTALIIAELFAIVFNLHTAEYFTKPALVISLLVYFLNSSKTPANNKILVALPKRYDQPTNRPADQPTNMLIALLFCLAGDIILLFDSGFVFGLAAFLIGHIFYILTFRKDNDGFNFTKNRLGLFILGSVLFGIIFLSVLIPRVDTALKIPIFIYACTILTMLVTVFNRFKKTISKISYNSVLIGALFFVISDTVLAINQFVQPFAYAHFIVMLTYGLAQYFIVEGFLKKEM